MAIAGVVRFPSPQCGLTQFMDDPLDIQDALQPRPSFGIEVLSPTIGTAPSAQSGILGLIMN